MLAFGSQGTSCMSDARNLSRNVRSSAREGARSKVLDMFLFPEGRKCVMMYMETNLNSYLRCFKEFYNC